MFPLKLLRVQMGLCLIFYPDNIPQRLKLFRIQEDVRIPLSPDYDFINIISAVFIYIMFDSGAYGFKGILRSYPAFLMYIFPARCADEGYLRLSVCNLS